MLGRLGDALEKEITEKAHQMRIAHHKEMGKPPTQLIMPFPTLQVEGIPIHFHSVPYYMSVDGDRCLHQYFPAAKK